MKPSLRLLKVLIAAMWPMSHDPAARPSAEDPQAETLTRWRVLPADLDLLGHMNNGRYLVVMDFARLHYLARMGLLSLAFKNHWMAPAGMVQIDFQRPLKPFERFEIGTQVLSWDNRWFYMRQTFRSVKIPGRTVATAYVRTIFRSPAGLLAPSGVVRMALGQRLDAPVLADRARAKFGLRATMADPLPRLNGHRIGNVDALEHSATSIDHQIVSLPAGRAL